MVNYPVLTPQQQKGLPPLIKPAELLPQLFEDSSHQVWLCQTAEDHLVLKTCDQNSIERSAFWQGMNRLFDMGFPNSLGDSQQTYKFLQSQGHFSVAEHIASEAESFVLTTFLAGSDLKGSCVEESWVIALAQHLGQLHQQTYPSWGALSQPQFVADQWSSRLVKTLTALAQQQSVPEKLFEQAVRQAEAIECHSFVPIMPDLRWDQCRLLEDGRVALIDLDAFVIGAKELELVLLEFLLDEKQSIVFEQHYKHEINRAHLAKVREAYRLLLFLMNVLGEQELTQWMTAPIRF